MYYLPIKVMGQGRHCKPERPPVSMEWWNCHRILSEVTVVKGTENLKCFYNSCLQDTMAKSLTKQFTGLLVLVPTSEGNTVHCDRKGMVVNSVWMNSIYSLLFFLFAVHI